MGYETRVGENGVSLSGGQRQRLAIARAVAHRPAMLLLDEATSHLDAVTEAHVDAALDSLACTRIVIAHRLSTIVNADMILVLDQGRLVECGTHEHLMRPAALYCELTGHQLAATHAGMYAHAATQFGQNDLTAADRDANTQTCRV